MSWVSHLRKLVDLSITKAEYVAITKASKEMPWLENIHAELGKNGVENNLFSHSQSVIHLAKNPMLHSGTKHILLRYHFL